MARKTIVCPTSEGGLGLKDFVCQGKALRLVALVNVLGESCHKCFYMAKYFCGARLAPLRLYPLFLKNAYTIPMSHCH